MPLKMTKRLIKSRPSDITLVPTIFFKGPIDIWKRRPLIGDQEPNLSHWRNVIQTRKWTPVRNLLSWQLTSHQHPQFGVVRWYEWELDPILVIVLIWLHKAFIVPLLIDWLHGCSSSCSICQPAPNNSCWTIWSIVPLLIENNFILLWKSFRNWTQESLHWGWPALCSAIVSMRFISNASSTLWLWSSSQWWLRGQVMSGLAEEMPLSGLSPSIWGFRVRNSRTTVACFFLWGAPSLNDKAQTCGMSDCLFCLLFCHWSLRMLHTHYHSHKDAGWEASRRNLLMPTTISLM